MSTSSSSFIQYIILQTNTQIKKRLYLQTRFQMRRRENDSRSIKSLFLHRYLLVPFFRTRLLVFTSGFLFRVSLICSSLPLLGSDATIQAGRFRFADIIKQYAVHTDERPANKPWNHKHRENTVKLHNHTTPLWDPLGLLVAMFSSSKYASQIEPNQIKSNRPSLESSGVKWKIQPFSVVHVQM